MPFTISHAGFVVPLRRWLSARLMVALMIGSVIPDWCYVIRQFGIATYAHSAPGAVLVSLPSGLLLFAVVMMLYRRAAGLLPEPHRGFLLSLGLPTGSKRESWFSIALVILLGAWLHNFVDSFTHETGLVVAHVPALQDEVGSVGGESIPRFRVLQYSGSILGMAMLLIGYVWELRRYCDRLELALWQDFRAWAILVLIMLLPMIVSVLLNLHLLEDGVTPLASRSFGFKFLITWIPLSGLVFLCFASGRAVRVGRAENH
jgi:hypothetical protein